MKLITKLKQWLASLTYLDTAWLTGFAIHTIIMMFIAAVLVLIFKLLCARL